jgi:hypothetical protein
VSQILFLFPFLPGLWGFFSFMPFKSRQGKPPESSEGEGPQAGQ